MNVLHSLRRYFKQSGRTEKTVKKIMQLVKSVYAENPAYFEKEDQFQELVEEKEPALKNVRGNMKGLMTY